jgi:hypothetical protein
MSTITTTTAYKTLKATLDKIITDSTDNVESDLVCTKYMNVGTMDDAYVDDLENGGPGLATERAEGQALEVGSLYEGPMTRYIARKFGLILQITEELEEDGKYNDKYINASRRLKRAVYKTLEIDCANVLNRAANASYVGGDGVSLASASHTIPGGGTFSNTLGVALSPSRTALISIIQNVMAMPGHDGIVEGYRVKAILHPVAQWGAWKGILGSDKVPESAFNEINVVHGMGIKQIPVPYWTGSSTNWAVVTDAPGGLKLLWRRKPKSRTWYDEATEVVNHGISARWARGWSDPRAFYFSNA